MFLGAGDFEDDCFGSVAIFDVDDFVFCSIGVNFDGIRAFGERFLTNTLLASFDSLEKSPVGPSDTLLFLRPSVDDLIMLDELRRSPLLFFITWVMLVNILEDVCF